MDYSKALFQGPRFLGENFLHAQRSVSKFHPSSEKINDITLWVSLYKLPMQYFVTSALISIAQKIGTPLIFDKITPNVTQGWFVYICIFVDCDKPLPWCPLINKLCTMYENSPSLCPNWGHLGQLQLWCSYKRSSLQSWVASDLPYQTTLIQDLVRRVLHSSLKSFLWLFTLKGSS